MARFIDLFVKEKCYIFYYDSNKEETIISLSDNHYLRGDQFIKLISVYDNESSLKRYLVENNKIDNEDIKLYAFINRYADVWKIIPIEGELKFNNFFYFPIELSAKSLVPRDEEDERIAEIERAMDRIALARSREKMDTGIIDGRHLPYIFK